VSPSPVSRHRAAIVPLRVVAILGAALVVALAWWTWASTRGDDLGDGRTPIVFWSNRGLGDDVYTVVADFERRHPQYRVILGTSASRNITGDAQRLLSTIAGGVPPDLVWFDRFAIGEWAARGALADLTPYLAAQRADDPYRIDLAEYYPFAVEEASYRRPGSSEAARIYGIPATTDIRLLYCNAEHLRQAGLVDERGEPRPPRTWEEQRAYATALSRWRDDDRAKGLTRLGFAPNYGNSWLYMFAWQAGGEFLSPDRTRVTMDSPPVARALRYMAEVYDDLGGFAQVDAFQQSFQGGPLDPFIKGQVSMKIDGNWSMIGIAEWQQDLDFIVAPAPIPADRAAAGEQPITWAGGFSFVIPATARSKEGAFELVKYLRSREVGELLEQGVRERQHSAGRLYLPAADANRVTFEGRVRDWVTGNPRIPRRIQEGYAVMQQMLPRTLYRPVSPVGQLLWNEHERAYSAGVNHTHRAAAETAGEDEYAYALRRSQDVVQRQLDEVLAPPPPHLVDWRPYLFGYAALIAASFAAIAIAYRRHRKRYGYKPKEVWAALMFASPWMVGFVVFVGGPILFSIVFSFTTYDVLTPARYVGLANYREVADDPLFAKSLWNTAYMIARIPLGMAISLAIALLLNHGIRAIGFYRTAFYLPSIMPAVAASLLWIWLFNPAHGALNEGLRWLFDTGPSHALEWLVSRFTAEPVVFTPPLWLNDQDWSKPGLILMNLWSAGGGMIIWLAGLQGIPQHLYEAASIDGAGRWQRFRHVTLPMLSPYILFNLVMGLIGTMQIFGEAFIVTQGGPQDSTLFYAYNLFNQAFRFFRMGYASALAWILFVAVLALTLVQLWLSKRWVNYDQA